MKRESLASLLSAALLACGASATYADIVSHDIGDPEMNVWKGSEWANTPGDVFILDERPDDPAAPKGAKTLRLECRYAAHAFGGWSAAPADNVLAGKPVRLEGWVRLGNADSWGMAFEFEDANTNKFNLDFKVYKEENNYRPNLKLTTEWQRFVMIFPEKVRGKVPKLDAEGKPILNAEGKPEMKDEDMAPKYPIKFNGASQNNWGDRNSPTDKVRDLDLYDFRLFTDMEGIAVNDRPCSFSAGVRPIANTFYYGEDKVELALSAVSWLGEERTLTFKAKAKSSTGEEKSFDIPPMKLLDGASASVPLPFTEPGAYTVELEATGFPKAFAKKFRYAVARHPRELTEEEKEASPYGLNVHGGGYVGYEKFARLGFVWVRDYAFNRAWMVRSRGEGNYGGWPWYPKIYKAAADVGMKTLPCMMTAVGAVDFKKNPEPDQEWRRQQALIVATFPQITAWELDNECDGKMWEDFDAYGRYCQAHGDIIHAVCPNSLAVSPGLAGIYVEQTQQLVEKGYFRNMDVVNGHRYCGIDCPELSKANLNTGMSEAKKTYLRDVWRHWKRAATCDGKFRQLWLTEWGWDTLAGQIVSETEQAAYMQRKWVLAMGNGVEKMFWYWYYDSDTDKPSNFFDGCGIFDRFREPKPVASAMAALRWFLPANMKYVGYANLGPNHMAHILEMDGKLIAMAFKIDIKGADLEIQDPKAEAVYDMFGAQRRAGKHVLGIDPTWYVGLDRSSDWVKQCPIDLESDFYVRNVSGEPVRIETVNRDTCQYTVKAPEGWTVEEKPYGFDVTGPEGAARGAERIFVTGSNGKVSKVMPIEVDIVPQAYAKSSATDFEGNFTVDVVNQSAFDQVFTVRGNLPDGWAIDPMEQKTQSLKPEEKGTVTFHVVSTKAIPATEEVAIPKLEIVNSKDRVIDYSPVIPREWEFRRMKPGSIKFDGDLKDWSPKYQMPRWMLGPRGDKELSRVFFGYADDGLYIAFEVDDSKCMTSDPTSFWRAADCMELCINPATPDFTTERKWALQDHQFWFCPLADQDRIYVGYWGHEGQEGVYDIPDVKTGLKKTARGYTMEVFIPASRIAGWNPRQGAVAGMMFTMAVQGLRDPHEIYWPASKAEGAVQHPHTWAKVKFGD